MGIKFRVSSAILVLNKFCWDESDQTKPKAIPIHTDTLTIKICG